MGSVLRTTATVIALAAISLVAYSHYHHRHLVTNAPQVGQLGGPIDRAVVITPREIGAITAGTHVAVLVGKNVLYRNMYVLAASTDAKTVTLRATRNQAAALFHLSRSGDHQLVLWGKPAQTTNG